MREPIRLLAVFLISLLALGVLAGRERLSKPSHDNHYSHLAAAWLDGRLHHEGKPPGWCTPERSRKKECRRHDFDDWAVVWTLGLADGSTLRGYPCKTTACLESRKQGRESWWVIGEGLRVLERGEIRSRKDTWYVSFPPGPALAMLPAVAIWGVGAWDVLITCLFAALIPVVLLRWFDRERGLADRRARDHLWAVAAWTFASPALLIGAHGRVWFTAQILGALCTCLYLSAGWKCRRPAMAGLWLGLAVSCRPHMALALPFFVIEWWRESPPGRARWIAALRFAAPLAVIGVALMWMNYARFGDVFEFGHRYLEIRWQQRIQEVGMFSVEYLGRNLQCAFSLLPVWREGPWDGRLPRVSMHGSSVLLGAPWLLALLWSRDALPQRLGLIASAVLVAIPSLLYQNSGQLQFSYRFALDWLPMLLAAIVFGGGAKGWAFRGLVVLGGLWQVYGAWLFGRKPGLLFVTDPLGWPFESELE
ncbi:hypothetical protein ACNOYE_06710 [Nannocystaceae bacterium ST9]